MTRSCSSTGEQKLGETKQWLGEKGSEALAKGGEILGATQQALATGAAAVTEKAKQGLELASEAASNVKAATGQLATDAQAKVVETAHTAQGESHPWSAFSVHFFLTLFYGSESERTVNNSWDQG